MPPHRRHSDGSRATTFPTYRRANRPECPNSCLEPLAHRAERARSNCYSDKGIAPEWQIAHEAGIHRAARRGVYRHRVRTSFAVSETGADARLAFVAGHQRARGKTRVARRRVTRAGWTRTALPGPAARHLHAHVP